MKENAARAFRILASTGTLSPTRTISFIERVPGHRVLVAADNPDEWAGKLEGDIAIFTFDGEDLAGDKRSAGGAGRFTPVFAAREDVTTLVHVHTPYLGAWSQSHRPLPIRYVPVQRYRLISEIPIYIDRRQSEADFIIKQIEKSDDLDAILEANGGATLWSRRIAENGSVDSPPRGGRALSASGRSARRLAALRPWRSCPTVENGRFDAEGASCRVAARLD